MSKVLSGMSFRFIAFVFLGTSFIRMSCGNLLEGIIINLLAFLSAFSIIVCIFSGRRFIF